MKNLSIYFLMIVALYSLNACTTQNIALEEAQKPIGLPMKGNPGIVLDISKPAMHLGNCGNKNITLTSSKSVSIDKVVDVSRPLTEVNQAFMRYMKATEGDRSYCSPRQTVGITFLRLYNKSKESISSDIPSYYLDILLDAGTLEPALMHTTLEKVRKKIDKKSYRNYQQRILDSAKASLEYAESGMIDFDMEEIKERNEKYKHSILEVIRILDK